MESPSGPSHASSAARLTAIVPVLHDDAALEELLSGLARLQARPDRVIVVDGASSDSAAVLCRQSGAEWRPSLPGRGSQLAEGIADAQATLDGSPTSNRDALWLLHADCQPHPQAALAIRAAIRQGAAGGYFRFRFGGRASIMKSLLERCIALRCRVGMVYGDQGIFVTCASYEASPGLDKQPLFEEVPLVRHLKRTRRFIALPLPITVSARRWDRDGFLRRTLQNRLLAVGYALGIAPSRLARWYHRCSERSYRKPA
ncbi:MAG: TIGR04283 family arsenosugar biosynthesis glycosyltransferase [Steroidobacteraceae bacterium]